MGAARLKGEGTLLHEKCRLPSILQLLSEFRNAANLTQLLPKASKIGNRNENLNKIILGTF
jgi:hypothetical protein